MRSSDLTSLHELYPDLRLTEDPVWQRTLRNARPIRVPAQAPLFRAGEACQNYLLVLEGNVRVVKFSEDGHEITLYHVMPGDTCEVTTTCLLASRRYTAEAIAETDVTAVLIPKADFSEALDSSSYFRGYVFSRLDERFSKLLTLVEDIAFGALDKRLAQCILRMADRHYVLYTTHHGLAAELGTAREVVSRMLKRFEKSGWVKLGRRRVEIVDQGALCALVGEHFCNLVTEERQRL